MKSGEQSIKVPLGQNKNEGQNLQQDYQIKVDSCISEELFIGPIHSRKVGKDANTQNQHQMPLDQSLQDDLGTITVTCSEIDPQSHPKLQERVDRYYNSLMYSGDSVIKGANLRLRNGREENSMTGHKQVQQSLDSAKNLEETNASFQKDSLNVDVSNISMENATQSQQQEQQQSQQQQQQHLEKQKLKQQKMKEKGELEKNTLKAFKKQTKIADQIQDEDLSSADMSKQIREVISTNTTNDQHTQRHIQQQTVGAPPRITASPVIFIPSPDKSPSPASPSPKIAPLPVESPVSNPISVPSPEHFPSPPKKSPSVSSSPDIVPSPDSSPSPEITPSRNTSPSPENTSQPDISPSPESSPSPDTSPILSSPDVPSQAPVVTQTITPPPELTTFPPNNQNVPLNALSSIDPLAPIDSQSPIGQAIPGVQIQPTAGEAGSSSPIKPPPPIIATTPYVAPPAKEFPQSAVDTLPAVQNYGLSGVPVAPATPVAELASVPSESITQTDLASLGYQPVSIYKSTPTGPKVYDGNSYQPVQKSPLNFEQTTSKLTQHYQNPYVNVSSIVTTSSGNDNQQQTQQVQSCSNLCSNLAPAQEDALQDLIKNGLLASASYCDIANIQCAPCGIGLSCVSGLTISISNGDIDSETSNKAIVVPSSIQYLNTISKLSIVNVPLVGNANFVSGMPLKFLQISNTKLGGDLPSFSQPQILQAVLMPNNRFTGFGGLASLEYFLSLQQLDLSKNQIHDSFPDMFINSLAPPLSYFDVSDNQIFGEIQDTGFDKLNQLYRFCVSNNQITGTVPQSLQGIQSLEQFCLDSNNFEGQLSLQASSVQTLQVSDNPNLCVNEASFGGITTGAQVSIFANGLGPSCVPGEPNVAVGFFSDANCGTSATPGQAVTFMSGSNYVCNTDQLYNPKTKDTSQCQKSCLDGVGSVLVYAGVSADFLDCSQKTQVMPSVDASKQARCIPLQDKSALKFINVKYGQVAFAEQDTLAQGSQASPDSLNVITLPFIAKVSTAYLEKFANQKPQDGYSSTVIDTSRYSDNAELKKVIKSINLFKTVLSLATNGNTLPKPEDIRVKNVYYQNKFQIIEALAIFNGQTDPILANSFVSMLTQNSQNILGPQSQVSTQGDVSGLGSTPSADAAQYKIQTKIIPQSFVQFTAINQYNVKQITNLGVNGWPINVQSECKDFVNSQRSKMGSGTNQQLMQNADSLCNSSTLLLYFTKSQSFDLRIIQAPVISLASAKEISYGAVMIQNGQATNMEAQGAGQLVWAEKFTVSVQSTVQMVFVMVAPGVISQGGQYNLPSQVVAIMVDTRPLTPKVTSNQRYNIIDDPQPSFTIDYGRTIVNKNAAQLFQISGVASMEGFYNPMIGQLQVVCTVANSSQPSTIVVTVFPNTAKDLAGNTNTGTQFQVQYNPPSKQVNMAYVGAYGLSWGTSATSAVLAVSQGSFTGNELTTGGLSSLFMIWATQKFTYKRQMAVPNLPEIYKQCFTRLEWVVFNIPLPWAKIFEVTNSFNNVTQSNDSVFGQRKLKSLKQMAGESTREGNSKSTQSKTIDLGEVEYFQKSHVYSKSKAGQIQFRNLLAFSQAPTQGYETENKCNAWGPTYRFAQPNQQQQQQIIAANSVQTSRRKILSNFLANLDDDLDFEIQVDGQGQTYGYKSIILGRQSHQDAEADSELRQKEEKRWWGSRQIKQSSDQSSIVSLRNYNNTDQQQSVFNNLSQVPGNNAMSNFERIIFWTLCVFLVVLILHLGALIVFLVIGKHPPDILLLPRFELTISLLLIPPLVGGCASLFVGTVGNVVLGVIIFLIVPFLLLFVYYGYLWFYISSKTPNKRKANYLVELTQEQEAQVQLLNEDEDVARTPTKNNFDKVKTKRANDYQVIGKLDRKLLLKQMPRNTYLRMLAYVWQWFTWLLIGPQRLVGEWVATQHPDSKYMAKYGSLFEDCQGRQVVRYNATYDIIPSEDGEKFQVDRGQLLILHEPQLLKIGRLNIFRTDFAVYGLLMEASKISLFAMLVRSINISYSPGQVIGMMCISLIHAAYVRILQPFRTRRELLIAQMGNLADIGTFICALLLLGNYAYVNNQYRRNVGIAMVTMEFVSLFGYFAERLSRVSYTLYRLCIHWLPWERSKGKLLSELVKRELLLSSDLLATKHLDRWMRLSLGRGLRGTTLRRGEQNFRQVIGKQLAKKFHQLRSISSLRSSSSLIHAQHDSDKLKNQNSGNSFYGGTPRSKFFDTFNNEAMKVQGDTSSEIHNSIDGLRSSDKLDSIKLYPEELEYSDNSNRRQQRSLSGNFVDPISLRGQKFDPDHSYHMSGRGSQISQKYDVNLPHPTDSPDQSSRSGQNPSRGSSKQDTHPSTSNPNPNPAHQRDPNFLFQPNRTQQYDSFGMDPSPSRGSNRSRNSLWGRSVSRQSRQSNNKDKDKDVDNDNFLVYPRS